MTKTKTKKPNTLANGIAWKRDGYAGAVRAVFGDREPTDALSRLVAAATVADQTAERLTAKARALASAMSDLADQVSDPARSRAEPWGMNPQMVQDVFKLEAELPRNRDFVFVLAEVVTPGSGAKLMTALHWLGCPFDETVLAAAQASEDARALDAGRTPKCLKDMADVAAAKVSGGDK